MKSPCAVNLHNAVTVSQQRLGKRVAQLSPARMNEVCAALRFSPGCDSKVLGTPVWPRILSDVYTCEKVSQAGEAAI
jgi:hypothetical protein